jgi:hypothetical protein
MKYEALTAILKALPVPSENLWRVHFMATELSLRGEILSKTHCDGTAPAQFRQASLTATKKQLAAFRNRTADLAKKIKRGGGETRAREQLASLIESMNGPAIEAIGDVSPNDCGGVLGDIHHLTCRLPARLRRRYPDDSAKTVLPPGVAEKKKFGENQKEVQSYLDSGYNLQEIVSSELVEVTVEELCFWSIVATAAENGEIRSGSDGRPPNRQLQSLSYAIAHAYWILTGKIPPIAANGNQSKPFEKYQSFFLDVLKALEVSSVVSHYASAAAKEVRKSALQQSAGKLRRNRGRRWLPQRDPDETDASKDKSGGLLPTIGGGS